MHALMKAAIAASLLTLAGLAPAQPGPPARAASGAGPQGGWGMGPGMQGGTQGGMRRGMAGRGYTHGWSMMTPKEREEHRRQMQQAQSPEECARIRDEHRKLMEERAKDRGLTMRQPRRDGCGPLRGKG